MNFQEMLRKLVEFKTKISFCEINELDICSKSLLQRYLNDPDSLNPTAIIKIQAIIDYMYEQVNIGNWKEVKPYLRKTIIIATYLRLLAQIKCSDDILENTIKESFKIIDFGILFGCPLNSEPKLLQNCAAVLNSYYAHPFKQIDIDLSENAQEKLNNSKHSTIPIEVINCPSMEDFYKKYILTETPVILQNCINHWPALSRWKDKNYLLKVAGLRTVSVELGSSYTDTEWTQKLMTIEDFIRNHIYHTSDTTGYLAQYQLFEQIPELLKDITEPDYCCFSESNNPVDIMAWYGPKGTISPLHHDPKRNLLAQVVGQKEVFLFSPKDSEHLYPHKHELLNNTARVDPRQPDFEKFPSYKNAKVYHCFISPGQMLYIPPKWWHFVESMSVSFSVSFWWE